MLLRDTIYKKIRRSILACELKPGEELREQVLAEQYRVSRSPIRDSLLRLEQENLVTVLPRQGYRVNLVTISDIREIVNLRLLIEPTVTAMAATAADDNALQLLNRFRSFADQPKEGDLPFNDPIHRAIVELSGNNRISMVALDLIEQFGRVVRLFGLPHDRDVAHGFKAEHEAIIDALQARNGDRAAQLAREHIQAGGSHILMAMDQLANET